MEFFWGEKDIQVPREFAQEYLYHSGEKYDGYVISGMEHSISIFDFKFIALFADLIFKLTT